MVSGYRLKVAGEQPWQPSRKDQRWKDGVRLQVEGCRRTAITAEQESKKPRKAGKIIF
jgi:hypothetical protein